MHVRTGRREIEHHEAVPGREGLHRNEVRFCLQRLLHRFTIFGTPTIGTLVLGS